MWQLSKYGPIPVQNKLFHYRTNSCIHHRYYYRILLCSTENKKLCYHVCLSIDDYKNTLFWLFLNNYLSGVQPNNVLLSIIIFHYTAVIWLYCYVTIDMLKEYFCMNVLDCMRPYV